MRWTFSFNLVATCWLKDKNLLSAARDSLGPQDKWKQMNSLLWVKASLGEIRLSPKPEESEYLMSLLFSRYCVGSSDTLLHVISSKWLTGLSMNNTILSGFQAPQPKKQPWIQSQCSHPDISFSSAMYILFISHDSSQPCLNQSLFVLSCFSNVRLVKIRK